MKKHLFKTGSLFDAIECAVCEGGVISNHKRHAVAPGFSK